MWLHIGPIGAVVPSGVGISLSGGSEEDRTESDDGSEESDTHRDWGKRL